MIVQATGSASHVRGRADTCAAALAWPRRHGGPQGLLKIAVHIRTFVQAVQHVSPSMIGHLRSAAVSSVWQPPHMQTGASTVQHGAGSVLQQVLGPHATSVCVPSSRHAPSQQKKPLSQQPWSRHGPLLTRSTPFAQFSWHSFEYVLPSEPQTGA